MGMLNKQQLCAELSISESTVRRLEQIGLPYTPIGMRSHRYDLEECKEWLQANPPGKNPTVSQPAQRWSPDSEFLKSCERISKRMAKRGIVVSEPTSYPSTGGKDDSDRAIDNGRGTAYQQCEMTKEALDDWVSKNTPVPAGKVSASKVVKSAPSSSQISPPGPRHITIDEWAIEMFGYHKPHFNTLRKWIAAGKIRPQPRKIGRRWWVTPAAE